MALRKNYSKNVSGKNVVFEDAYIQIIYDSGDKQIRNTQVTIYDGDIKENIIDQRNYSFVPNTDEGSTNFIKQGYEYLKTLVEYQDAEDC